MEILDYQSVIVTGNQLLINNLGEAGAKTFIENIVSGEFDYVDWFTKNHPGFAERQKSLLELRAIENP